MFRGILCRAILFPKCAKEGVFDELALLQLIDINRDKTVYGMSLASRFLLRTDAGAHGYGERTARQMNADYERARGEEPPENKRVHYVGFYDVVKEAALSLPISHYRIELKHKIEHGEKSHFNFELHPLDLEGTSDKQRRQDRNTAMYAMVKKLAGPKLRPEQSGGDQWQLPETLSLPPLPPAAQ